MRGDGIPRPNALRPVPDDFAALAPTLTMAGLARHYVSSHPVVSRWLKETGVKPKDPPVGRVPQPIPPCLAGRAVEMNRSALARHYEVHFTTIETWLAKLGIKAAQLHREPAKRDGPRKPVPARSYAGPKSAFTGRLPQEHGEEAEAANVLRRYAAVYRCTERGGVPENRKMLTHWRFGNVVMTRAELIERARAKGWKPDAWMEIAA